MADTLIQWLIGLIKSIPKDIIKALISGFVILILRIFINKAKFLNSKIKNIILKFLI